ncbi:DUF2254 domain-containing protein [Blastococcus sp. TBT05-19]|uniref:DUF2254 domain-containing protein n=1 Tax=Blastococcus sp. TBT05-19 TaxID=2250581 RepID=UPI0013144F8A|nr:DUF2254 domain-containing protein [Blastococcus sp. TBT05-19]
MTSEHRPSALRRAGARAWAALGSSLWPVPVLAIVVAIGLGIGLPAADQLLQQPGGRHPLFLVFGGGPSAARDLLAAIAGSLISVTGLTFSFTVVALQLSSSQHSPRLLQTFVTDRVVQATLGLLVGTFVYALTVLRTVRAEDAAGTGFVPRISVTVGFVLTLASVVGLVLFLGHLARSLRVETMLRDVSDEARGTYARVLADDPRADGPEPVIPASAVPTTVCARRSGFLTAVDRQQIAAAAAEADAVVLLEPRIGDSVVAGTPVAHIGPSRPGGFPAVDAVERALHRGLRLDFERTPQHDVAYSLRKVVDIAVRALSPGTNDPTTAVHALSHVSALLGELVAHPLRPTTVRDDEGVLRLVVPQWDMHDLLRLGLEEPLHFASGQPAVLRRVAGLLREVAWRSPRGPLDDELRRYLDRVVGLAEGTTALDPGETALWRRRFDEALAGRWAPEG